MMLLSFPSAQSLHVFSQGAAFAGRQQCHQCRALQWNRGAERASSVFVSLRTSQRNCHPDWCNGPNALRVLWTSGTNISEKACLYIHEAGCAPAISVLAGAHRPAVQKVLFWLSEELQHRIALLRLSRRYEAVNLCSGCSAYFALWSASCSPRCPFSCPAAPQSHSSPGEEP